MLQGGNLIGEFEDLQDRYLPGLNICRDAISRRVYNQIVIPVGEEFY